MEWKWQMAPKQIKIIARVLPGSCAGTTGLKEGLPWIRAALAKRMLRGARGGGWSRKRDLTTLGTLKRSLTSRIKLRHCNCRRRRHCDSTFPSLFSSDSSFRYLPSLTHSSQLSPLIPLSPSSSLRYRSRSPFVDKGIQFSLVYFISRYHGDDDKIIFNVEACIPWMM